MHYFSAFGRNEKFGSLIIPGKYISHIVHMHMMKVSVRISVAMLQLIHLSTQGRGCQVENDREGKCFVCLTIEVHNSHKICAKRERGGKISTRPHPHITSPTWFPGN